MTFALDADKADALQELVNLGMGSAGATLATVLGAFVELKVPGIEVVAPSSVGRRLLAGVWGEREFLCVRQGFFGGLSGEALMLLHGFEQASLGALFGHDAAPRSGLDEEVALDIANAVMGACISGITQVLEHPVSFSPPCLLGSREATAAAVTREISTWRQVLLVDIDFHLEGHQLESRVLIFLAEGSLARIDRALAGLLGSLAASEGAT
jgi:chemotaxis protein CheC